MSHSITCEGCSNIFLSKRRQRFCGIDCRVVYTRRKKGIPTKQEADNARRNSENSFICEQCGTPSHRRPSGTNKKAGTPNRWCSMKCRKAYCHELRVPRQENAKREKLLNRLIRAIKRYAKAITPVIPRPLRWNDCIDCATSYVMYNTQKVRCPSCHDQYRNQVAKCKAAKFRKSPEGRARKLKDKTIRRARQKINADSIDPIAVFDRDGWICKMCGIDTPRELRGKHEPSSPELDHIVPLALGGHHTWDNVQCSCRSCNGLKGANMSVNGELRQAAGYSGI